MTQSEQSTPPFNPLEGLLPEELQAELRQQVETLLHGPSFEPVDITEQPGGAPEDTNYLDMFNMGLDHIVTWHANALRVEPVEPVVSAQDTLNRLAVSGFSIEEMGGLLAAAVDRLARLEADSTESNDSVQ